MGPASQNWTNLKVNISAKASLKMCCICTAEQLISPNYSKCQPLRRMYGSAFKPPESFVLV
jgi:hypothetical protein